VQQGNQAFSVGVQETVIARAPESVAQRPLPTLRWELNAGLRMLVPAGHRKFVGRGARSPYGRSNCLKIQFL
jgi:hypothetical protein